VFPSIVHSQTLKKTGHSTVHSAEGTVDVFLESSVCLRYCRLHCQEGSCDKKGNQKVRLDTELMCFTQ
jgi:hypothetical protein